jgi:ferredoxin
MSSRRGSTSSSSSATRHQLSVNNDRCHRYGTCQYEAPDLFQLTSVGLRYRKSVGPKDLEQAKAAVRCCPMMAITLEKS